MSEEVQTQYEAAKNIIAKLSADIAADKYEDLIKILSNVHKKNIALHGHYNVVDIIALNAPKEILNLYHVLFLGIEKLKSVRTEVSSYHLEANLIRAFTRNLSKIVTADKHISHTLSLRLCGLVEKDGRFLSDVEAGADEDAKAFFQASPRDALYLAERLLDMTKDVFAEDAYICSIVDKFILNNIEYINDGLEHNLPKIIDIALARLGKEISRTERPIDYPYELLINERLNRREDEEFLIKRIIPALPKIAENNQAIAVEIAERVMRTIEYGRQDLAGMYRDTVIKILPDVLPIKEILSKSLLSSLEPQAKTDIIPKNDPALPAISKPVAISAGARVALVFDIAANTTLMTINGRAVTKEVLARNKHLKAPVVALAEQCTQSHPAVVRMATELKLKLSA